jgi:WD40 repeat protein
MLCRAETEKVKLGFYCHVAKYIPSIDRIALFEQESARLQLMTTDLTHNTIVKVRGKNSSSDWKDRNRKLLALECVGRHTLATSTSDNSLCLWDTTHSAYLTVKKQWWTDSPQYSICWAGGGMWTGQGDGSLLEWRLDKGTIKRTINAHQSKVSCLS